MATLSVSPTEEGTIIITPSFNDEEGGVVLFSNLITPVWLLVKKTSGVLIDSGVLDTVSVVLTCEQLQLLNKADDGVRVFGIAARYHSTNGASLCIKGEVEFTINNLVTV